MDALHELGFSRAACDWLVSGDCAILLLRIHLRVGFVEMQETVLCAGALFWS